MDDMTKKKPNKPGRQRGAPPAGPVAADTLAAAPEKADGHVPDAALKPMAEGAATLAHAVAARGGALPQPSAPAVTAAGGTATNAAATPASPPTRRAPTARGDRQRAATAAAPGPGNKAPCAPEIVEPPARKKGSLKPVEDSFAVPKEDHATLAALKDACRANGVPAKKNQLLRVAIGLLREVEPARLAQLVAALPPAARKKK